MKINPVKRDGWLGLETLHRDELAELKGSYIEDRFQQLAQRHGGRLPQEIVWQFWHLSNGKLFSPSWLLPGEERGDNSCAQITLRRQRENAYEIVSARGDGAPKAIASLRAAPIAQGDAPVLRISLAEFSKRYR